MTTLSLDAEALYQELLAGVRPLLRPDSSLVGIWSGGAWLAERLQRDLGLPGSAGTLSSALHRDDFGERGMSATTDSTQLPFAIDGRHILLVDDVLTTGATAQACARALKRAGAADITVLTLARVVKASEAII